MKKYLFIICLLSFVACGEKQHEIKEANTVSQVTVEPSIEELVSKDTIDVEKVKELLSKGKLLPIESVTLFINQEIEKMSPDSSDKKINYEKLYQLYSLGFTLSDAQNRYKEELKKAKPNFYVLGTYLLYGADINTLNSKGQNITQIKDEEGRTVLYSSCYSGYTNLVKELIEKKMDVNFIRKDGKSYMDATIYGEKSEIKDILIAAGFDLKKQGLTPLMLASVFDIKEVVESLIKAGANVNEKNKGGWTPLMYASQHNKVEVVESLIKAGANINEKNKYELTPLMYASLYNKVEVAESLIKAGANVNEKNIDGWTPLMLASQYNKVEVVEILIKAGANINEKNKYEWTPLKGAIKDNKVEVAESLIKAGANVNEKNIDGWTPLMLASQYNKVEVVEILIKNGANINEKNKYGMTAYEIAKNNNHTIIQLEEKMLQQYFPYENTFTMNTDIKKQYQLKNENGKILLFENLNDAQEVYTFYLQKDFQAVDKFINTPRNKYNYEILINLGKEPIKVYLTGYSHEDESEIIGIRKVGDTKTYWTFRTYLQGINCSFKTPLGDICE